jgi:hypothetical protein
VETPLTATFASLSIAEASLRRCLKNGRPLGGLCLPTTRYASGGRDNTGSIQKRHRSMPASIWTALSRVIKSVLEEKVSSRGKIPRRCREHDCVRRGRAQIPRPALDRDDALSRHHRQLCRPRDAVDRWSRALQGTSSRSDRHGLRILCLRLVLCDRAGARRLASRSFRIKVGLCDQHPDLVTVHDVAGLGRHLQRGGGRDRAVRLTLPGWLCRSTVLSCQCAHGCRVVSRQ